MRARPIAIGGTSVSHSSQNPVIANFIAGEAFPGRGRMMWGNAARVRAVTGEATWMTACFINF
jgi:hypothetical protein